MLDEWDRQLVLEDFKARTRAEYRATVERVFKINGWTELTQVTTSGFKSHLSDLAAAGRSAKWIVNVHSAVKGFMEWAKSAGYVHVNAAVGIKLPNPKLQPKRRKMRPFTPEQMDAIADAAERDEHSVIPRFRLVRSVYYRVLQAVGARRSEVAGADAIRWRDIDLDSHTPGITFDQEVSKGTDGRVPLIGAGLDALRRWRARCTEAGPDDLVFPVKPNYRILHHDMENAGVPKRCPTTGRSAAFHSFRRGFCTDLARSGVSATVAKDLMRHADIKTTLDDYTELGYQDKLNALEATTRKKVLAPQILRRQGFAES